MGDWNGWVDFIVNTATNDYNAKNNAAEHPATFHIQIGGKDTGDAYAASAGYPHTFINTDCKRLGDAAMGTDSDVFGNPPKGFTILRPIPCENDGAEVQVLTGKHKGDVAEGVSQSLFTGSTHSTLVVGLVDIKNSSKGLEVAAAGSFGYALCQAMNNNV